MRTRDLVTTFLARFEREAIYNYEAASVTPTRTRELLLMRTKILKTPLGNLDLHVFHASDAGRELHDHPWSFITLLLWNGYTEVVPVPEARRRILAGETIDREPELTRRRRWPLALLFRPAKWAHRVELAPGKISVSLIWTFPKRSDREWGFYTSNGWVPWKDYCAAKELR